MQMTRSIRKSLVGLSLVGLLVASSVGCTGAVGGPPSIGPSSGTGNSTGRAAPVALPAAAIACVPGIPATTQLRRMLNREYDATVRDLLGVTSVSTATSAGPPSSLLYADFDGPMVPDAWRIYQDVGAAIAKAVMANATLKAKFISCDPAASGCLTQTIQTFGRRRSAGP